MQSRTVSTTTYPAGCWRMTCCSVHPGPKQRCSGWLSTRAREVFDSRLCRCSCVGGAVPRHHQVAWCHFRCGSDSGSLRRRSDPQLPLYRTRALRHIRPVLTLDAAKTTAHDIVEPGWTVVMHCYMARQPTTSAGCERASQGCMLWLLGPPASSSCLASFIGCRFGRNQLQNCADHRQSEVSQHFCLPAVFTEQLYSCADLTLFRQEFAIGSLHVTRFII